MQMWTPRADEPELHEWWRPLIEFARRLRAERFPWPVHLDEFELAGRVDRRGKPSIWTYRHLVSRGFVAVDDEGRPYRFITYRKGPSPGRFTECELRRAGWIAGLPDVVEPIDWTRPPGDVGVGRAVRTPVAVAGRPAPSVSPHRPHVARDDDWDDDDRDDDGVGGDDDLDGPGPEEPRPAATRPVRRRHLRLVPGSGGDVASRPA